MGLFDVWRFAAHAKSLAVSEQYARGLCHSRHNPDEGLIILKDQAKNMCRVHTHNTTLQYPTEMPYRVTKINLFPYILP
jgi:hypothetical protein